MFQGASKSANLTQAPAPRARALIRDEELVVQNADAYQLGDRTALSLSQLEDVTLIVSAKTEQVFNESPRFIASRLYVESRLRQSALQGDAVVPAHQVLRHPARHSC